MSIFEREAIREYEVKLTVRVALNEKPYGDLKWPFTPTTTEVSEAIAEILTMEESAIVQRVSEQPGRFFDRDSVHLDIEGVERNLAVSAAPGTIDEIRDAELKRRREQEDIAKHAEQRSVENDERNKDG